MYLVIFGNNPGKCYLCLYPRDRLKMKDKPSTLDSRRESFLSLYETILSTLETEISTLPDTLKKATPGQRLDFITRTLPLVFRFKVWDTETKGGVWE